jgi:hypothetical protein
MKPEGEETRLTPSHKPSTLFRTNSIALSVIKFEQETIFDCDQLPMQSFTRHHDGRLRLDMARSLMYFKLDKKNLNEVPIN